MDEFFNIEKVLGEVAGVINLTKTEEPFTIDTEALEKIVFPKIKVEAPKVKVPVEGEEEEEEAPAETPVEEEKAPDFDPRKFNWTMTDGD